MTKRLMRQSFQCSLKRTTVFQMCSICLSVFFFQKHSVPTTKQLDPYPLIQFRKDIAFSAVERLKRVRMHFVLFYYDHES